MSDEKLEGRCGGVGDVLEGLRSRWVFVAKDERKGRRGERKARKGERKARKGERKVREGERKVRTRRKGKWRVCGSSHRA